MSLQENPGSSVGFREPDAAGGLTAAALLQIARECGADDCGVVSIDAPALAGERRHIARAFPATRTLLSIIGRMHREPVRSPARSVANLEFHRAGHEIDEVRRPDRQAPGGRRRARAQSGDGLPDGDG